MADRQRLLELALKGLEAERATIDDEITQIKSQLNPGSAVAESVATARPQKKTMSAAARKKISEAMKRRYAEINRPAKMANAASQINKTESVALRKSSGKRENGGNRLTAAVRKKLSDLMKKRWAAKRKAKAR